MPDRLGSVMKGGGVGERRKFPAIYYRLGVAMKSGMAQKGEVVDLGNEFIMLEF